MRDRPIEKMQPASIDIVGEQPNGRVEAEFKHLIIGVLQKHPAVAGAYLARVKYPKADDVSVALLVHFTGSKMDARVIRDVALAFKSIFSSDQHMDIIPIDDNAIRSIPIKPFYSARVSTNG